MYYIGYRNGEDDPQGSDPLVAKERHSRACLRSYQRSSQSQPDDCISRPLTLFSREFATLPSSFFGNSIGRINQLSLLTYLEAAKTTIHLQQKKRTEVQCEISAKDLESRF